MPCPHRVVGIGDVDELRAGRGRQSHQRLGVVVIAFVRRLVQHPAIARDVEIERRVGAVGGDDRIPRFDQQTHQIAEQPVDPFAHGDMGRGDAMMIGQRGAQIVVFRVAIHPHLLRRLTHGEDGGG